MFTNIQIGGDEKTHVVNPPARNPGQLHLITAGDLLGDDDGSALTGRVVNLMFKAPIQDKSLPTTLKFALEEIPGIRYFKERSVAAGMDAPSLAEGPVFRLTNEYTLPTRSENIIDKVMKEGAKLRAVESAQTFLVVSTLIEMDILPEENKKAALEQLGLTESQIKAFENIINPPSRRK